MHLSASAILLLSASVVQAETEFKYKNFNAQALCAHILPRYERLQRKLDTLAIETRKCTETEDFDYSALRHPFRNAVMAWGGVAHITFGPVAQNNRYERIFFWPDRRGISRRQVTKVMRLQPDAYSDPKALAQRSISVQGLPAFELLITKPTVGEQSLFKCAYMKSISRNLASIAGDIVREWRPDGAWSKRWLSPGPENPSYLDPSEPAFTLIRAFLAHIDRVRDIELFRPLGFARQGRKLSGPFARSDLTMTYIAARLAALRSAIVDTGLIAEIRRTAQAKNQRTAIRDLTEVAFELDYLVGRTSRHAKVSRFFATDRTQEAAALGYPMTEIRSRTENAIAAVTNLPFGFNSSLGD
ncbi:MAG: imelysin family protein [Cyanobacteria bacterium J06648_11]